MLRIGQAEIDAVAKTIQSGKLFRYQAQSQCEQFEKRYARFLRSQYVHLTSSGTNAITAALIGLGIGPGDEVAVPAHTYMATAISVLAAGAIPLIIDVDESITIDPQALDDACGPRTKAVIPVHMWGVVCDMDAIMKVARKRKLLVIEDACQCVGGAYEGRKVGSIGHAGAFSFNYFKNMTCGEGGAVSTNDPKVSQRARCAIDSCGFFWTGRSDDVQPFAASGARASELEGAVLNAQLDRLPAMIQQLRGQKRLITRRAAQSGLKPSPQNSPNHECGTTNLFLLPTAAQAQQMATLMGCGICAKTGRHTYTEWDPILNRQGAHHPALDPFLLPQNRKCRKTYSKDMCPRSLDILGRTIMVGNSVDRQPEEVVAVIAKLKQAAQEVLGHAAGKPGPRHRIQAVRV